MPENKKGSLTVVGTGINALAQCSIEARSYIEHADVVYVLVTDELTLTWVRELNPHVIDLQSWYQFTDQLLLDNANGPDVRRPRSQTYEAMTEALCEAVREGKNVTAVFYGHPGVFVWPSNAAIRQLRIEGYPAQMLPAVSAEDCLFADIGVDPCENGCVQYEATAFVYYRYHIDPSVGMILWQPGVLGDDTYQHMRPRKNALAVLAEKLLKAHPPSHKLVIYEAANFPLAAPRMTWLTLADLPYAQVTLASTLYIPPSVTATRDEEFIAKLDACPREYEARSPVLISTGENNHDNQIR